MHAFNSPVLVPRYLTRLITIALVLIIALVSTLPVQEQGAASCMIRQDRALSGGYCAAESLKNYWVIAFDEKLPAALMKRAVIILLGIIVLRKLFDKRTYRVDPRIRWYWQYIQRILPVPRRAKHVFEPSITPSRSP